MVLLLVLLLLHSAVPPASGEAGSALLFDGLDDYVTVMPGFQIFSSWTIEFWVMPVAPLETQRCLLSFKTASLKNLLTVTSTAGSAWDVVYGFDRQTVPADSWVDAGGTDGSYHLSHHHVALTHDAFNGSHHVLQLYLNSTLHATWHVRTSAMQGDKELTLPVILGACHELGVGDHIGAGLGALRTGFFKGYMDEIRLWEGVRSAGEIRQTWQWSGAASEWPALNAAQAAGYLNLRAQYPCDALEVRMKDATTYERHGWRGTLGDPLDSPLYVQSPFEHPEQGNLQLGAILLSAREGVFLEVNFAPYVFSRGVEYNALLIVANSTSGTELYVPRSGRNVTLVDGSLVAGSSLEILATQGIDYDNFRLQPCTGSSGSTPDITTCTGNRIYDVSVSIWPSRAPIVGPVYAVQLLSRGAFIRLPRLPVSTTVEAWISLTAPLHEGATLFSVRERVGDGGQGRELTRLSLAPAAGGAVMDVCARGRTTPMRFLVPGLAVTRPQHLAISFGRDTHASGWRYIVKVYQDCVALMSVTVSNPCLRLDSPMLWQPTIGQRYVLDEPGSVGRSEPWSESFTPMYINEIRIWDYARANGELCAARNTRLNGDEQGLVAYMPVTEADVQATAHGSRMAGLSTGRRGLLNNGGISAIVDDLYARPEPGVEVRCSVDFPICSDFERGVGFVMRISPFELMPSVVHLATTPLVPLTVPLVAHDPDNYRDSSLANDSIVDDVWFEIFDAPDPSCGSIYGKGERTRIVEAANRARFGLPATAIVPAYQVPLRFVPFDSTPAAQQQAQGGTCTAELRYRALDSGNKDSRYEATIRLHVLNVGLTLDEVRASDLSAAGLGLTGGGGLLHFVFSEPTNEANKSAWDMFRVVNGSWGSSSAWLRSTWSDDGRMLIVEIAASSGADLKPGWTRFEVREAAGVQRKNDELSFPCSGESPALLGGFQEASCVLGHVLNFTSGACEPCPPGTYWVHGATTATGFPRTMAQCLPCPAGHFSVSPATLACSSCKAGTYLPADTMNRTACLLAPAGTFVPEDSMSGPEPCLDGSLAEQAGQVQCKRCPDNADCRTSGYVGIRAFALPEYFRGASGTFHRCRIPSLCPGANVCVDGAADPALGCYACPSGRTRGSGALRDKKPCTECPGTEAIVRTSVAVVLATALLAYLLASLNISAARRSACLHPFMLKIGLGHLMMMQSLVTFESWEYDGKFSQASMMHDALSIVLGWDGAMPLHVIPLDCLLERHLRHDSKLRLWFALGVWFLLPAAFALFCLALSVLLVALRDPRSCILCCRRRGTNDGHSRPKGVAEQAKEDVWQMAWSQDHNRYYYHNSETGVSQWVRPPELDPAVAKNAMAIEEEAAANALEEVLEDRFCGVWRVPSLANSLRGCLAAIVVDSSGIMISAMVLAYPPVLRQVLALLRCGYFTTGSAEPRLLVAPEIVCGSPEHSVFAAAAWVAFVLFGLGVPAAVVWLVYPHRRQLGLFSTKVHVGVLSAEYELSYYYWDAVVLLRRCAVILASTLTPDAPPEMRLALLLGIGIMATVLQHAAQPFDNRSGLLLDVLEGQGLKVFCVSAAVMILGFSNVLDPIVASILVLVFALVHIVFLARLLLLFLIQVRRSLAEAVVESHMKGRQQASCCGAARPCNSLMERVFLFEMDIRRHRAVVSFDPVAGAIKIESGLLGAKVVDQEQLFVAHGIADCVAHLITDCHLERISGNFLEYVVRQAFYSTLEWRQCTDRVHANLALKFGSKKDPVEQRDPPNKDSRDAGFEGINPQLRAAAELLDPKIFQLGMPCGDFQGALMALSLLSRSRLEYAFLAFMCSKGLEDFGVLTSSPANFAKNQLLKQAGIYRNLQGVPNSNLAASFQKFLALQDGTDLADPGSPADGPDSMQLQDVDAVAATTDSGSEPRDSLVVNTDGSLTEWLAGDATVQVQATASGRGTPEVPQPAEVCHCRNGHRLVLVGPSQSGWVCDAGRDLGGCLSGVADSFQSTGLSHFECRICNYNACEQCHSALWKMQSETGDVAAAEDVPGLMGEDDHGAGGAQYHPASIAVAATHRGGTSRTDLTSGARQQEPVLKSKSMVFPHADGLRGAEDGGPVPVKKVREHAKGSHF